MFQDLRYALRLLAKRPGFSAAVILMLALGIGINTTVFSWIETLVLDPLPGVADPERLAVIVPAYRGNIRQGRVPYPDFQELAGLSGVWSGIMGSSYGPALLDAGGSGSSGGSTGASDWVFGRAATVNTFDLLGVHPFRGRFFLPSEDSAEGSHPVLVISYDLWQRRFDGDPQVLGRTVDLNRHLFQIVGITPPGFQDVVPGLRSDFWAPLSMHKEVIDDGTYQSRTNHWIQPLARLRPGVGIAAAQAAMTALSQRLEKAYPDSNLGVEYEAFSLRDSPIGGQAAFLPILTLLLAVGAAVLLIVVLNVANLLLARAVDREREIALRLAIGGGRSRLIRQLLTESLVLALLGGVLGALFASAAVRLFSLFLPVLQAPLAFDFHLHARTLAFTLLLTLGTTVLFGLVPALKGSRAADLQGTLQQARSVATSPRYGRLQATLVAVEVGLSLVLLIGAGLCVKGLTRARRIDLGFATQNLLTCELSLSPSGYSPPTAKLFDRRLRARLASLPGVTEVSLADALPLGNRSMAQAQVQVDGDTANHLEDRMVSMQMVSPGYFSTLRIPLLAGRDFTDQDNAQVPNVAILNETMARRFWPGQNPLGRTFRMAVGLTASAPYTVIGIVRSGKYRALDEPPAAALYLQYEQRPIAALFMTAVLRTKVDPASLAAAVRREVHALDPRVEPRSMQPLQDYIKPAFTTVEAGATLLSALGLTALALAALGLYGVMAYVVSRRTYETGVRIALGARPGHVFRQVLGQALRLVFIGEALGLLLAFGVTHGLASVLYGVSPRDPLTFSSVPLIFALIALLACYGPIRRALRVDPAVTLRQG
jgi:predicted permease